MDDTRRQGRLAADRCASRYCTVHDLEVGMGRGAESAEGQ